MLSDLNDDVVATDFGANRGPPPVAMIGTLQDAQCPIASGP